MPDLRPHKLHDDTETVNIVGRVGPTGFHLLGRYEARSPDELLLTRRQTAASRGCDGSGEFIHLQADGPGEDGPGREAEGDAII